MTAVGIEGIWDLDEEVAIYNVLDPLQIEGWMSLRVVMYSKLKLSRRWASALWTRHRQWS